MASELHAALGADVEEVMITKWSSNPYIKGAWSYARVNSSVEDRNCRVLGPVNCRNEADEPPSTCGEVSKGAARQ